MEEEILNHIKTELRNLKSPEEHQNFQNHLYGCLVIVEMIEEGKIIKKRIADEFHLLDANDMEIVFETIGDNYGFDYDENTENTENTDTKYVFSNEYKKSWNNLFLNITGNYNVLLFEQKIVNIMQETEKKYTFFLDQIDYKPVEKKEINIVILKRKSRKTIHLSGHRSVTPIKRKKGVGKTKKAKIQFNEK